ncbi:acyltransferase [bacterium]|nr:acyltransferase [bacterium]
MQFRYDINGLRAYAVIAVVLYHFSPTLLPGGFAGVDVFFVISGFLMTSIIFNGINNKTFSLLGFYRARGKRIIPALSVLCLFLLCWGWFYLPPMDYELLAKHAGSSLFFFSNITYLQEAGYFDAASHEKWLLHTWSLSVEWQFYIVYPIVLMVLSRLFSIKNIKVLILLFTLLAFAFSLYASYRSPSLAFYSLPTRAWEMMLGGIAFLFPLTLTSHYKKAIQLLGILLIVIAYTYLSGNDIWPGYLALIPALGAFLIIAANNRSLLTDNKLFQWLGNISYSLYLWHWPVVVALKYFEWNSYIHVILGIIICILLSTISYYLIEKNLLKKLVVKFSNVIDFSLYRAAFFIGLFFAGYVFINSGIYSRDEHKIYQQALEAKSDWSYPQANFSINGMKVRKIESENENITLFLGDSLIEQYYPRFSNLHSQSKQLNEVWFLTNGGCFPIASIISFIRDCRNINYLKEVLAQNKFDKIVVGGDWLPRFARDEWHVELNGKLYQLNTPEGRKQAFSLLGQLFETLSYSAEQVYVVLAFPSGDLFDYQKMARKNFIGEEIKTSYSREHFDQIHNDFNSEINSLASKYKVNVINPLDFLCDEDSCSVLDETSRPRYKDIKHLRSSYVKDHVTFLDFTIQ